MAPGPAGTWGFHGGGGRSATGAKQLDALRGRGGAALISGTQGGSHSTWLFGPRRSQCCCRETRSEAPCQAADGAPPTCALGCCLGPTPHKRPSTHGARAVVRGCRSVPAATRRPPAPGALPAPPCRLRWELAVPGRHAEAGPAEAVGSCTCLSVYVPPASRTAR